MGRKHVGPLLLEGNLQCGTFLKLTPFFALFFGGPYSLSFYSRFHWDTKEEKEDFFHYWDVSSSLTQLSRNWNAPHLEKKSTCFSSPSPLRHRLRWSAWVAHIVFYYYRCCCGFTQVPATATTTGQKGRKEKRAHIFAGCVWVEELGGVRGMAFLLLPILITSFSVGPPVSPNIFAF